MKPNRWVEFFIERGVFQEATAKDTYAKDIDKKTIVYKEYSKTLYDDRVTYTTAYAKCK